MMRWNGPKVFLLAALVLLSALPFALAEGSRNLMPSGASGNRHYLRDEPTFAPGNIPATTTFFVYMNAGETLNLGSSANGIGSGRIRYRAPAAAGFTECSTSGVIGRITTRAQELAGPLPTSGGYTPCTVTVGASEGGVWELVFSAPRQTSGGSQDQTANASWPAQTTSDSYVTAWDAAVRSSSGTEITGRLFTNVLSASHASGNLTSRVFVQTSDGYRYSWNVNGVTPGTAALMANRQGFTSATSGNQLFRSVQFEGTNPGTMPTSVRIGSLPTNPTVTDYLNGLHKLFFNPPAADLPTSAPSPRGTTWLLNPPVAPASVTGLRFVGLEGTVNQTGTAPLSGNFQADVTGAGTVTFLLDVNNNSSFSDPVDRLLSGTATGAGTITIPWDGLDGGGVAVTPTAGSTSVSFQTRASMSGGEVHFPALDFEGNVNGFIIQRLDPSTNAVVDSTVYFDSRRLPSGGNVGTNCNADTTNGSNPLSALTGISSATGAHRWTGNYGNCRGMDTWAYVLSPALDQTIAVRLMRADLEVVSVTPSVPSLTAGGTLSYTVVVRNNGPSDSPAAQIFGDLGASFAGATIISCTPTGGATCTSQSLTGNAFSGTASLPSGGSVTYVISGTVSSVPAGGNLLTTFGVQRQPDITDPTATNANAAAPVQTLQGVRDECNTTTTGSGDGNSPTCNNLKTSSVAVSPNTAFACDGTFYQVRSSSTETSLLRFSTVGGTATSVWTANASVGLNGLAYSPTDNFLYAFRTSPAANSRDLYRLNSSGATLLGQVVSAALTDSFLITGATFDQSGRLYFVGQGSGNIAPSAIYRVDIFADSDPGTAGVQITVAATYALSATTLNVGDIAFGPDGNLYGATGSTVYQFALSGPTATVTQRTIPDVGGIGSAYFDNNYVFYVYNNGAQTLSRVDFGFGSSFATAAVGSSAAGTIPYTGSPALPASIGATDGASCIPTATTGTIGGALYRDNNTNGTFETGTDTTFPANISVQLVNNQGTPDPSDDVVVQTAQTNASGAYSFTNVPVGSIYTIRVVSSDTDIPAGSAPTAPTGAVYTGVQVVPGTNPPRNFGYQNIAVDVIKSAGAPVQVSVPVGVGFEVPFTVVVGSTGAQTAPNVQVSENLSRTFASGNPTIALVGSPVLTVTASTGATCTANPAFNGTSVFGLLAGTDDLASGQSCTISLRVRLTYPNTAAIPTAAQNNQVYASSLPGAAATNPGHTFPGGTPTAPTGAITTDTSSNSTNPATPAGLPGTPSGDTSSGTPVSFTLNPGSLSGTLYIDQNNNNAFNDSSDPRLGAGVTVELVNGTTVVGTTTTDSDGNYRFNNVDPGSYTVRVVTTDPDLRGATPSAPASGSLTATINPGAATVNQNFGFVRPGLDVIKSASTPRQIDVRTFEVTYTVVAGNTGSTPLPNVQLSENLNLTFASGNPTLSVSGLRQTGGSATCTPNPAFNGTTVFGLLGGTDDFSVGQNCTLSFTVRVQYPDQASVVREVQRNTVFGSSVPGDSNPGHSFPGGTPTPPTGAVTTDISSNTTNPASPSGLPTTPGGDTPGGTPVSFSPGLGSISGTLYNDLNGNRSFDDTPQDRRLGAGTTVELVDSNGTVVGTTTTDGSGNYSFNAVQPGTYSVRVPTNASNSNNPTLGTLQPVAPTGATIGEVTVAAGSSLNNRNFGFNNPPVADNDSATTPFNTPVTFSAVSGDTDPDGFVDPSTIDLDPSIPGDQKTRTTAEGTWSVDSSGNITFTPASGFSGTATILYTVRDNTGNLSNQANLTVTVQPAQPPLAVNDSTSTLPDTNVTLDPKRNDSTPNRGASIVPTSVVFSTTGQPAGTVVGGDGKSLFVPNQGLYTISPTTGEISFDPCPVTGRADICPAVPGGIFLGAASPIVYTFQDSIGQTSNPATVTITVQSPAARNDSATTPFDTSVTLDVPANDVSSGTLDRTSVVFPAAGQPTGAVRSSDGRSIYVPNQGLYTVSPTTGVVSFDPCPVAGRPEICADLPEGAFSGVATPIRYEISDSTGPAPGSALIQVTVGPPAVPVANPDSATTPFGTPVNLNPVSNDTAGSGTNLVPGSIDLDPSTPGQETVRDVPGQGRFELNPSTGIVTFTPVPGFAGTVQVPYTIKDNLGQTSAPSTLTVNVTPPPAPVARDDQKAGDFNQNVEVPAALNDSSSPNTTLVPGSIDLDPSTPQQDKTRTVDGKGTFTVLDNGTVVFDPIDGFTGTAVVPYTIKDNLGQTSNPANISVTIRPRPAPPVANDDNATTPRNIPVTLNAIGNDSANLPNTLDPNSIDLDPSTPGRQTSFTVPGRGTFVVGTGNDAGKVIFTPVDGFTGVVTTPYTISDNGGQASNPANLTLTITPLPAAVDDRVRTPVNTPVNIPVVSNDVTNPGQNILPSTIDLDRSTPGQQPRVEIPGQGVFEIQPDGTVQFTPAPGFVGTATTPYTVQDSQGATTPPANIVVTVVPPAPTANDDLARTPFNTPVTLNPNTNDVAGTGGQLRPSTIDLDPSTPGQQTEFTVPGQGRFVLQPATNLTNESVQFIPENNFSGTVTIPYTIGDNFGQTSNLANLTVIINPPSAPIANNDITSTKRDTPVNLTPVSNDTAGAGTTLVPSSIDLDPNTPGQQTRFEVPGQGVFVLNPDGTVTFTPAPGFTGTVQAPYTINDAAGQTSNTARLVVTINPLPAAANDAANTPFNTPVTLNPLSNDTPTGGATFNPATLDLDPLTPGIQDTLTVTDKGTFTRNPDGTVTFTPVNGFTGTVTIPYTVQDSSGSTTNTANISVTVIPPAAPVANNDETRTPYNTPVTLNPAANDRPGNGGTLVPGSIDLDPATPGQQTTLIVPGKGTFTLNPDGTVTFTPVDGFVGVVEIPYTIRDNAGQSSNPATIKVTVVGPNLTLRKEAVQGVARIGGTLEYILTVKNDGAGVAIRQVTIEDLLPLGLQYRAGSSTLNGARVADPQISNAGGRQRLVWVIGDLAPGQEAKLRFATTVTAAAPTSGQLTNSANASGQIGPNLDPIRIDSNTATAAVRLEAGVFSPNGEIVGRVYFDRNRDDNFTQGIDEPLQGARVYLSNGRFGITDNLGRYSITNVEPGTWAVRVDRLTVPYVPKAVPDDRGLRGTRQVRVEGAGIYTEDFLFEAPRSEAQVTRSTKVTVDGQRLEKTITQVSAITYTVTLTLTLTKAVNNLRITDPLPAGGNRGTVNAQGLQPSAQGNTISLGNLRAGTYTLTYTLSGNVPIDRLVTDPDLLFEEVR